MSKVDWPPAVVAVAVIGLIASISVAAVMCYPVDDALKVLARLAGFSGLVTSAVATYFFSAGRRTEALARRGLADEEQRRLGNEFNTMPEVETLQQRIAIWLATVDAKQKAAFNKWLRIGIGFLGSYALWLVRGKRDELEFAIQYFKIP